MAVRHAVRRLVSDPDRCHVQEQVVHWLEQSGWEFEVLLANQTLDVLEHLDSKLLNLSPLVLSLHLWAV